MKKFLILMTFVVMSLSMSANSILYFTRSQANRCVKFLNAQDEMMIYCGYDNEIETYVIISDIWAERVTNKYYELWVFGYDAYTGEEIYMPLDLGCVWLSNRYSGRLYNAAQYLRFRCDAHVPTIIWTMPAYNHFTRTVHVTHYVRTYHYDIHRPGWVPPMPPAPHHGGPAPHPGAPAPHPNTPVIHPYYLRTPGTPAPTVTSEPFTPGQTRPTIAPNNGSSRPTNSTTTTTGNVRPAANTSSSSRPSNSTTTTSSSTRPAATTTTNTTNSRPGNTSTGTTTTNTRPTSTSTSTSTTSSRPTSSTTKTTTTTTRPAATTTTSSSSRPSSSATKTNTTTTTRTSATTTSSSRPASTSTKTTTTSTTRPTSTSTATRTTTSSSSTRPTSK
ncbi:MAG: hypothetical protein KBT45_02155 [Bacteroidales bacterium]|nr:hypothetical protein [Candidatus Colimorpha pelethequi]